MTGAQLGGGENWGPQRGSGVKLLHNLHAHSAQDTPYTKHPSTNRLLPTAMQLQAPPNSHVNAIFFRQGCCLSPVALVPTQVPLLGGPLPCRNLELLLEGDYDLNSLITQENVQNYLPTLLTIQGLARDDFGVRAGLEMGPHPCGCKWVMQTHSQ